MRIAALIALAGLLACSHDAQRANPLDPRLTPPVELRATLSDTAGTAMLSWTPYDGEAPFADYLVLRNVVQSVVVDTLARLADRTTTTWVDSTPVIGTAYSYRVSVRNSEGAEATSLPSSVPSLGEIPVDIVHLSMDAHTATAGVTWSRYHGPRFAGYEVRRQDGQTTTTIAQFDDIDDTTWVDTNLRGAEVHAYTVTVHTADGAQITSQVADGVFHELVATWPIGVQGLVPTQEQVRLYAQPGGGVAVLLARESESVRLVIYDGDGTTVSDDVLLSLATNKFGSGARPTSAARLADGTRLVAVSSADRYDYGIVRFHPTGASIDDRLSLRTAPVPGQSTDVETVLGEVGLVDSSGSHLSSFRRLVVTDANGQAHSEDFAFVTEPRLERLQTETRNGWTFRNFPNPLRQGFDYGRNGEWLEFWGEMEARRQDSAWDDGTVSVEVTTGDEAAVDWGGEEFSRLTFHLREQADLFLDSEPRDELDGWLQLDWRFQPPEGSTESSAFDSIRVSYPVFSRLTYTITLSMTGGVPQADVVSPELWHIHNAPAQRDWASLAATDDNVLFTSGDRALSISADGIGQEISTFDSPVSETRTWRVDGESLPRVAVCQPRLNRVRWGSVRSTHWTSFMRRRIGQSVGADGGALFYPVSMDGAADGRFYILDAGNARVVVLDSEGNYITEFGGGGSDPGHFDFGNGVDVGPDLNYGGSIAVGEDGFIYVADVGNGRIQKFAP